MAEDRFEFEIAQRKLTVIEKVVFLQNIDVFASVPTEQLAFIASIAEEIWASAGEVIYNEKDPADALYLVVSGQVQMQRASQIISVAGKSEAFGSWALFDNEPRVVTACAAEETRLLRVDREDFFELLADHVQITQGILKALSTRLRFLVEKAHPASSLGASPESV